ncbi:hypothetical protein IWX81_002370 [Salinibacterium sp. CAN_S4]
MIIGVLGLNPRATGDGESAQRQRFVRYGLVEGMLP